MAPGTLLLLPVDPDESATRLRTALIAATLQAILDGLRLG